MASYTGRKVKLTDQQWDVLHRMVDDRAGTVTVDYFIGQAVAAMYGPNPSDEYGTPLEQ